MARLEIRLAERYGDDEAHVPERNRQYLTRTKNLLEKSQWLEAKLKELQGDGAQHCKLGHVLYSPPNRRGPRLFSFRQTLVSRLGSGSDWGPSGRGRIRENLLLRRKSISF